MSSKPSARPAGHRLALGVELDRGQQAVRLRRIRHLHGWPPSKRLTHLVAVLRSVARAAPSPEPQTAGGPPGRARAADDRAASASPVCSVVRDRHLAMLTRNSPQRARPPVADDHGRAGLMRPSTGSRSCDRRAARAPFMRGEERGDETNERPPGVDPDEVPGRRFVAPCGT